MKRNVLHFLVCIALVVSSLFMLTACGEKKPVSLKVFIGANEVTATNKTLTVEYGTILNVEEKISVKLVFDDESTQTLSAGTDANNYTYTITPTIKRVPDAGTYKMTISYGKLQSVDIKIVVTKSTPEPTVAIESYTYGSTVPTPTLTGVEEGNLVKYYYNTTETTTGAVEFKDITGTSLDAGKYYLFAVVQGSNNYFEATSPIVAFEVKKCLVEKPTAIQTEYSANLQTVYADNNAYTATNNTQTVVGTYDVEIQLNDKTNYAWADGTMDDLVVVWNINKKTDNVSRWPELVNKVDSVVFNENLTVSSFALDDNGVSYTEGTFAWKNPEQKVECSTLSAILVFTPTDTANYAIEETEVYFPTITPAHYTTAPGFYFVPYEGATPQVGKTVISLPYGDYGNYTIADLTAGVPSSEGIISISSNWQFSEKIGARTLNSEAGKHLGAQNGYSGTYYFSDNYTGAPNADPVTGLGGYETGRVFINFLKLSQDELEVVAPTSPVTSASFTPTLNGEVKDASNATVTYYVYKYDATLPFGYKDLANYTEYSEYITANSMLEDGVWYIYAVISETDTYFGHTTAFQTIEIVN